MFVYNVKFNKKFVAKLLIILLAILVVGMLLWASYLIFINLGKKEKLNDTLPSSEITNIDGNYANILKIVHDDLDTYIGQKISCTGYVYRVPDISENNFIIARDMQINSGIDTVVIGFLCDYPKAMELENNTWIQINGTIEKGNYFGELPIIKITSLDIVSEPENNVVNPPDANYIPTSNIY